MDTWLLFPGFFWLFFLCFAFILFQYFLILMRYNNVPGPRPRLPVLGNTLTFFRLGPPSRVMSAVVDEVFENYKEQGLVMFVYLFSEFLILFKPEYVTTFLNDYSVIDKAREYTVFKAWLGDGLITTNGQKWKHKRKLLNPTFHRKILADYVPVINDESFKLVEKLRINKVNECIDIRPVISECTLNVIAKTAIGLSIEKLNTELEDYVKNVSLVQTSLMKRVYDARCWYDFIFQRLQVGKQCKKQILNLHNFTRNVIKERRKTFKSIYNHNNNKQTSFLDLLLIKQSEDETITDDEIREDVDTFIFAGHDTSASCLIWTLHLLSINASVQQKLKNELICIFEGDKKRNVTMDHISKMHYMHCVIKESLRLYPPVPIIGRVASSDFVVEGHRFKKGTSVFVPISKVHRDEEVFERPNEFIPERFENCSQFNSFIPFAIGPRNCIGQQFAMIEMKIILAHIFRTFTVSSAEIGKSIDVSIDVVLKPVSPVLISFQLDKTS